jgi:hypothetical protein
LTTWQDKRTLYVQEQPGTWRRALAIGGGAVVAGGLAAAFMVSIQGLRHEYSLISDLSTEAQTGAMCEINGNMAQIVDLHGKPIIVADDFKRPAQVGIARLTENWQGDYQPKTGDAPLRIRIDDSYPDMCNVAEIHFPLAGSKRALDFIG